MGWDNPILGGENTLIRTAIKSPNYVAGSVGWSINKVGSAEFNDAVIRGSLVAGSGNTTVNAGGIKVSGTDSSAEMNIGGGFIARRIPDDGSDAQMTVTDLPTNYGGIIGLRCTTPTANGNNLTNGSIYAYNDPSGGFDRPEVSIASQIVTGGGGASVVRLRGKRSTTVGDDSQIDLEASKISVMGGAGIYFNTYGVDQGKGRVTGGGSAATLGPYGSTETQLIATQVITFKAGRLYSVRMTGGASITAAPNRSVERLRKDNGTIPPTGQILGSTGLQFANTSLGNATWEAEFSVGGSDVTCALLWSTVVAVGVVGVNHAAPMMSVYDIGIASETGANAYTPVLV